MRNTSEARHIIGLQFYKEVFLQQRAIVEEVKKPAQTANRIVRQYRSPSNPAGRSISRLLHHRRAAAKETTGIKADEAGTV